MKPKANRRHRQMMSRTYSIFRHQRERAKEFDQDVTYNLNTLRNLVAPVLGTPCSYCGEPIESGSFSLDHGTPVSRGGSFALHNLVVSCRRCNDVKGNMTAEEFGTLLTIIHHFPHDIARSILSRLRAGARLYN